MQYLNLQNKIVHPYQALPKNFYGKELLDESFRLEVEGFEGVSKKRLMLEISGGNLVTKLGLKHSYEANLYFWNSKRADHLEACNLIDLRGVSREHAYIKAFHNKLFLISGSIDGRKRATNGVYLNGRKLSHSQGLPLKVGDLIGLGPRSRGPNHAYCRAGGVTLRVCKIENNVGTQAPLSTFGNNTDVLPFLTLPTKLTGELIPNYFKAGYEVSKLGLNSNQFCGDKAERQESNI